MSTPGHGQGVGPDGFKWSQTTQKTLGGAGAQQVYKLASGVLQEESCLSLLEIQDLVKIKIFRVGNNSLGGFVIRFRDVVHDMLHVELDFV